MEGTSDVIVRPFDSLVVLRKSQWIASKHYEHRPIFPLFPKKTKLPIEIRFPTASEKRPFRGNEWSMRIMMFSKKTVRASAFAQFLFQGEPFHQYKVPMFVKRIKTMKLMQDLDRIERER